jgi:hypothetical protein
MLAIDASQAIILTLRLWPGLSLVESRANRNVDKRQVVAELE